jgi:subfamily B ATP-binding cassette protein MsbA
MKLYLRIMRYLRPHLGMFSVSVLGMIVFSLLDAFSISLLIPFLGVLFNGEEALKSATALFGTGGGWVSQALEWALANTVVNARPMDALRSIVLLLFAIFFVKNVAGYVQQYAIAVVEARVTRDVRNEVYGRLMHLGFPFFQRMRTGQIISRISNDVDQMRLLVTGSLSKLLSATVEGTVFLVLLLNLSWKLTLVALLCIPPMLILWGRFRRRLRRGVVKVLDAVGEVASQVQETVSGVRLVKASGAEEWERARFERLTRSHFKAYVRNERWRRFFAPATEMISATAILFLLWYGAHLVLEEKSMAASAFITALIYAARLMSPVKAIAQYPAGVQPGMAAAERAFELLDAPVEVIDRLDALPMAEFHDVVRYQGVRFDYAPGTPALQEIDLEIRRGQVVALVGPSGAGKSTMADLLPRFYDPTAGTITLDGVDVRELRLRDLRNQLGIVTQETILFHDTVRNNIAYGLPDAPMERVEAAARASNAHDFIATLPEGYDTVLGERGTRLSGGQRQRIAIARALLRNPPILILDEATSALDTESERLVQQAIDELMAGRTVLVIAHRLSTVRRADQIVVLEGGRIVQRGTHEELLREGGMYSRLYEMQFGNDRGQGTGDREQPAA